MECLTAVACGMPHWNENKIIIVGKMFYKPIEI